MTRLKNKLGLSQAKLSVQLSKDKTRLLTANFSAISQPIELKFFLVTLQWVIAMSRLQKNLSSRQELLQPALLVTVNISAISQPFELIFYLVTLQWVIAMSRLQKILSISQELLQPALLVTVNISAISQAIELQNFCCNLFQR